MKKIVAGLFALSIVMTGAFGFPGHKAPAKTTIHCAVLTNNTVNIADATKAKHYADYKGRRYFFCCGNCPQAFQKDPAKYAKSESVPIPHHHKS